MQFVEAFCQFGRECVFWGWLFFFFYWPPPLLLANLSPPYRGLLFLWPLFFRVSFWASFLIFIFLNCKWLTCKNIYKTFCTYTAKTWRVGSNIHHVFDWPSGVFFPFSSQCISVCVCVVICDVMWWWTGHTGPPGYNISCPSPYPYFGNLAIF